MRSSASRLITILPILSAAAIYSRKKIVFLLISVAATIGWIAVMLSLSKGAFLAGIAGIILMFAGSLIFSFRTFRRRTALLAAVWLVVTITVQVGFSLYSSVPATTDYITGKADATRSTSLFRIFARSISKQMIGDNLLVGVGADNFGIAFNDTRIKYRLDHPDDPKDELGDFYVFERAHNELLQVAAELGLVGLALLLVPFGLFFIWLLRVFAANKFRISPMLWASLGGMTAFAVGSMFSSFSFRAVQNGIVFFLVFAIAVREIEKAVKDRANSSKKVRFAISPALAFGGVILSMSLILTFLFAKGAAEYTVFAAENESDTVASQRLLNLAVKLDPNFAGAYILSAGGYNTEKDYTAAANAMQKASVAAIIRFSVPPTVVISIRMCVPRKRPST